MLGGIAGTIDCDNRLKVFSVAAALDGEIVVVDLRSGDPGEFNFAFSRFSREAEQFNGQWRDRTVEGSAIGQTPGQIKAGAARGPLADE